jgi:hypothetical protein
MNTKLISSTVILCILLSGCIVFYNAQVNADVPPESLIVELGGPANNTAATPTYSITNWTYPIEFDYNATLIGADTFYNSSLIINGTAVVTNQTAITNATFNSFNYNITANGVYIWNVQVYNSTMAVNATEYKVFIMAATVELPSPATETPLITPTPTLPVITSTPTSTPTPTEKPEGFKLDTLTVALIIVVLAIVIGAAAYILLRRK